MYFNSAKQKQDSLTSEKNENVYLSGFISTFVACNYVKYFFYVVRNTDLKNIY